MSPLLGGACIPSRNKANETSAVNRRVLDAKTDPPHDRFVLKCMDEFAEFVVPDELQHTGVPLTYEEYTDTLKRSSQWSIHNRFAHYVVVSWHKVKCFLKSEPYNRPKAPRIISPLEGLEKAGYSRYTVALSKLCKQLRFYAFGHDPAAVADQVARVVNGASHVLGTDYETYDGTVNSLNRELELKIERRWLSPEHIADWETFKATTVGRQSVTTEGVKFNYGYARMSGEPGTSVFNTFLNAFSVYLAWRHTRDELGNYYTPHAAYQMVQEGCVVGGDDGLTRDLPLSSLDWAAKRLGLKLKQEKFENGEVLAFLGRWYGPSTWAGHPDTCADIPRQMLKFHLSFSDQSKDPLLLLRSKALSLLHDDGNTPILGQVAKSLVTNIDPEVGTDFSDASYHVRIAGLESSAYPNGDQAWMARELEKQLPGVDLASINDWCAKGLGCPDVTKWLEEFPTITTKRREVSGLIRFGDFALDPGATLCV
jgi:hypothetical protein